jgi:hypothetical protein
MAADNPPIVSTRRKNGIRARVIASTTVSASSRILVRYTTTGSSLSVEVVREDPPLMAKGPTVGGSAAGDSPSPAAAGSATRWPPQHLVDAFREALFEREVLDQDFAM